MLAKHNIIFLGLILYLCTATVWQVDLLYYNVKVLLSNDVKTKVMTECYVELLIHTHDTAVMSACP